MDAKTSSTHLIPHCPIQQVQGVSEPSVKLPSTMLIVLLGTKHSVFQEKKNGTLLSEMFYT